MKNFSFEDLEVYQLARELVKEVYTVSESFPKEEMYGLTSQLRRAMVSIVSNIAEGSGRISVKEKIHFVEIAYGSSMEAFCQLQVAVDLEYINADIFEQLRPIFYSLTRLLKGLRQSFLSKLP